MTETKRVPREPTPEMCCAVLVHPGIAAQIWTAMYDAAPDVPSEEVMTDDTKALCERINLYIANVSHSDRLYVLLGAVYDALESQSATIERLERELAEARTERDALNAALRELVECEDLKERAGSFEHTPECLAGPWDACPQAVMESEYARRKPAAWAAARALLAAP